MDKKMNEAINYKIITILGILIIVWAVPVIVFNGLVIKMQKQVITLENEELLKKRMKEVYQGKITDEQMNDLDKMMDRNFKTLRRQPFERIFYALTCIVAGIAIIKRKNWGRLLLSVLLTVALFIQTRLIIYMLTHMTNHLIVDYIVPTVSIVFSLLFLLFLNQSKLRKCFM